MKGLYLGVPDARERAERVATELGTTAHVVEATHPAFGDLVIDHHPVAWPDGPVLREGTLFAAASGWLVHRGRLGDLAGLARAFRDAAAAGRPGEALRGLDAGAFVLLISAGDEAWIVTDPFGLHPHYTTEEGPFRRLAPAPTFVRGDRPRSAVGTTMLQVTSMAFGNLTGFEGVERLEPGAVIGRADRQRWFRYSGDASQLERIPEVIRSGHEPFAASPRVLPLSGGLDSRLILATSGSLDHGYTFGPEATGDRPVARRFRDLFGTYDEFSLLELEYPARLRDLGHELLDGVCSNPFLELLPIYRRVRAQTGDGWFLFDGFLGDALVRGIYLTHAGVRGAIAKLLPPLTMSGFDPVGLMRRRYPGLPDDVFRVVAELFEEKTAGLDLDGPHRMVLFEMLYGRGTRYVVVGGSILSNQYFAAVQPFCYYDVFPRLFAADANETVRYRTMGRVWSRVPARFADAPTSSGYKPTWPPDVARASMLVTRALARKGWLKRAVFYASERKQVHWT
jgi:hypothetical protein